MCCRREPWHTAGVVKGDLQDPKELLALPSHLPQGPPVVRLRLIVDGSGKAEPGRRPDLLPAWRKPKGSLCDPAARCGCQQGGVQEQHSVPHPWQTKLYTVIPGDRAQDRRWRRSRDGEGLRQVVVGAWMALERRRAMDEGVGLLLPPTGVVEW
ncbi:hypothetical protein NDU88_000548 [Pleurodeles waltl]|uniref:Uncharacterized protein n=1 Tax=Pleurodeles waltl TaxID=8319 RepID=A0AAV7VTV2_PLEWA|nr:hypothetical protein NDU88_000548 [Pleurodeles waltl]